MSEINIQLELNTVLNSIKSGDGGVLAEVIKKLLMADYEIFKQLNEIGHQIASLDKSLTELSELLKEEEEEEEEVEILDADTDD